MSTQEITSKKINTRFGRSSAFGWLESTAVDYRLAGPPSFEPGTPCAGYRLLWIKLLIIALVWQFVLSMLILYREEGTKHSDIAHLPPVLAKQPGLTENGPKR